MKNTSLGGSKNYNLNYRAPASNNSRRRCRSSLRGRVYDFSAPP